jgi:late competence protein required for DNA uptake (superfamily II DNA/RNA helicase)
MTTHDGGKGDRKRPLVIPEEQFNANWDAIFKPNPLADKMVKQIEEHLRQQQYITPED